MIHGRLNSLTRNHGHRGAEDGKELHKREADDRSCVDFQLPPATQRSRVACRCGHSRGRLQDEKGQRPVAERTLGGQAGEEVPEPWSETGRGTGEKCEGKP